LESRGNCNQIEEGDDILLLRERRRRLDKIECGVIELIMC
jgi:hypothetical protein